jgi:hypothetical protein
MGKWIVEVPLDSERLIFAEMSDTDVLDVDEGLSPASRSQVEIAERAGGSVESAMTTVVTPTADTIFTKLLDMPHRPETIELEFGLKFNGKTGVIFASTEVEGHIQVKLSWSRQRQPDQ